MREKTKQWETAAAAYDAALARDDSCAEWHAGLARMREQPALARLGDGPCLKPGQPSHQRNWQWPQ